MGRIIVTFGLVFVRPMVGALSLFLGIGSTLFQRGALSSISGKFSCAGWGAHFFFLIYIYIIRRPLAVTTGWGRGLHDIHTFDICVH